MHLMKRLNEGLKQNSRQGRSEEDHHGRGSMNRDAADTRFASLLTVLYAAIAALGMYNHEMWRDEFEIFMKMRDIPNFLALFPNIQPAPNLYYSLLYPIVKLWPHPAVYQIFHLAVITAAVFIFNRYSPFTKLQKVFFSFSYFVLFEYGIISREYSMLMLLLFFLIYLITKEKQNFIFIAGGLFLLSNHHIYGVFFSLGIVTYLILKLGKKTKEFSLKKKKELGLAAILLVSGALYIFGQYFLSMKFNRYADIFGKAPVFMTMRSIWNAFFPVPDVSDMHFWNTNILAFPHLYAKDAAAAEFISAGNILAFMISIFVFLASLIIFSRKIPVLAAFLVNFMLHLIFLQYLSVFYVRYQGPLFMIFIYSYWLLCSSNDELPASCNSNRPPGFFEKSFFVNTRKFVSPYVTFLLFVQFCAGIFCYVQDARYPFTASYAAAKYIRQQKLENITMAGYVDYVAQAISGHLNQRIYYPQSGESGTYVNWLNENRSESISVDEVIESAVRLSYQKNQDILLILNSPILVAEEKPLKYASLYRAKDQTISIKYLDEFTDTIVPDEQYFLYLIYRGPG